MYIDMKTSIKKKVINVKSLTFFTRQLASIYVKKVSIA